MTKNITFYTTNCLIFVVSNQTFPYKIMNCRYETVLAVIHITRGNPLYASRANHRPTRPAASLSPLHNFDTIAHRRHHHLTLCCEKVP